MPDVLDRIGEQLVAAEHALHAGAPVIAGARTQRRRLRRRTAGSRLLGAGIAVAVAGGGYAAAAAAGVVPNPWSGPAMRDNPFVTSPDPAGTVRLAVPGPDATVIEIVANDRVAVGDTTVACAAVVVKEPQRGSEHLTSSCGGASALRPENGVIEWQAPSGAGFAIVSGQAPAGATEVSLTGRSGAAVTEPTGGGYFLVYVPVQELPPGGTLAFTGPSGQAIGRQDLPPGPGGA